MIKIQNDSEGLNGRILPPKNFNTCSTERATCHDFLKIYILTEELKRAHFKKRASHSDSYKALKTGHN